MAAKGQHSATTGAICPNCHELLQENLRQEVLTARGSSEDSPTISVAVTFCGVCGFTLATNPETYRGRARGA
jgi:RNase P subunit RPR2